MIGGILATAVVAVAAILLFVIIALGRRITRQAVEITAALDGAREHTNALYDVTKINLALDRITRNLRTVREGLGAP